MEDRGRAWARNARGEEEGTMVLAEVVHAKVSRMSFWVSFCSAAGSVPILFRDFIVSDVPVPA